MTSEHINIKLNKIYMDMIKEIARTLDIKEINKVYGSVPMVLRFCITFTHSELERIYNVIPALNNNDLDILLLSIKKRKIMEFNAEKHKIKPKLNKRVIPINTKNL